MKAIENVIFDIPIKPNNIHKSAKFNGAYHIPGYNGQYFLHEPKSKDGKIAIEYVYYQNKWREDTYYFEPAAYNEIMQQLASK